MKIKLKKDLPDYPAGTVFELNTVMDRWEFNNRDNFVVGGGDIDKWLHDYQNHSDWFERIDETPLYWEPEDRKKFYFIHVDGKVDNLLFEPSEFEHSGFPHSDALELGNAFPTKEAAQAHVEYLKALTRVRKYIQEHGIRTDCKEKHGYEITSNGALSTPNKTNPVLPKIWGNNAANQVIDNCHDDLKTIFGVES